MKFDLEYTELSPLTDFEIDIYEEELDFPKKDKFCPFITLQSKYH